MGLHKPRDNNIHDAIKASILCSSMAAKSMEHGTRKGTMMQHMGYVL